MTNSRNIPSDLAKRMIALADALGPLVNDAEQIHYDLMERGNWGTGVTRDLVLDLGRVGSDLRYLVSLSDNPGRPY